MGHTFYIRTSGDVLFLLNTVIEKQIKLSDSFPTCVSVVELLLIYLICCVQGKTLGHVFYVHAGEWLFFNV